MRVDFSGTGLFRRACCRCRCRCRLRRWGLHALTLLAVLALAPTAQSTPPSRFGIDAPELATLGPDAVGIRTVTLVQHDQPDVLAFDAGTGRAPLRDRVLKVEVWYPARADATAPAVSYSASLPSMPPAPPAQFEIEGLAVREAAPLAGRFPLLIVSHGYSNDPAALSWLTENLASKGYVVAAIRHEDPPITDPSKRAEPFLRRPLDIAFVAQSLPKDAALASLIDPQRVALFGYSMGGYGVLLAAGATLDPSSPVNTQMPGRLLAPYARGGAREGALRVANLKAVVAMAPVGGGAAAAFGIEGMRSLRTPLLLIAGDRDHTVDYASGARMLFEQAVNTSRYLLTFKGAGHDIGFDPAPVSMRQSLWNYDWFTDPVWRTERVNEINAHFITAFLDRYVKGDESKSAYLEGLVPVSAEGGWSPTPPPAYGSFSPGAPAATLWKGFQAHHAEGLEFLSAHPEH